jgi:processive 1,2-diacylglycerol beta-glucosyltransferase
LYGLSYRVTNQSQPDPYLNKLFHAIGRRKMKEIVDRLQPHAVIHTFPYLAMSELSGSGKAAVPTYTVLTDYVLHSRWIHPDTDGYFVATEQLKQSLMDAGIQESRIAVSGIPIRESFAKPQENKALRTQYGLDPDRHYVLLSAGAYGVLGHVRQMVQGVLKDTDFDSLLVCGKNRKLQAQMEKAYSDARIRVMGYVEHMEELMAVSSCLLTKAGGITLTEAISLSLPVIVYRPLPGQEQGNADVLSEHGALRIANNVEQLTEQLKMIQQEAARKRMSRAMKTVYRPHAAEKIVSDVLEKLGSAVMSKHKSGSAVWPLQTS